MPSNFVNNQADYCELKLSIFFLRFDSCTFFAIIVCFVSIVHYVFEINIIFLDRSDGLSQYPLFFLTALIDMIYHTFLSSTCRI